MKISYYLALLIKNKKPKTKKEVFDIIKFYYSRKTDLDLMNYKPKWRVGCYPYYVLYTWQEFLNKIDLKDFLTLIDNEIKKQK